MTGMKDGMRDNAGVIAPPPLIFAGPLALGLLLDRALPAPFLPRGLGRGIGWSLITVAVALDVWFLRTMRAARTPIEPWKPVRSIATGGPFRYSRNPSYGAFTMVYAGVAAIRNTLWPILLLPAVLFAVQRGVIEREERYLEQKFGDEYLRYKARVRRWL